MAESDPPTEQVLLVGSIPSPSAGASQHVWRLAMRLAARGCAVLDLHPGPLKYPMPGVALRQSAAGRVRALPWLLREIRRSPARVIHFHFSRSNLLGLVGPLILWAGRGKKLILTLHHGDQSGPYTAAPRWLRPGIRFTLRRLVRIVSLSPQQSQFYREQIKIPADRLYEATSYIGVDMTAVGKIPPSLFALPADLGALLLVCTGSASPYSRHEWAIELVDQLRPGLDVHLAICISGKVLDPGYLAQLHRLGVDRPHLHFYRGLEFDQFMLLLRRADLLLRPSAVDSYGMVVADAIAAGVPALASDICRRHPGAELFPTEDQEAFRQAALQMIQRLPEYRQRVRQEAMYEPEPAVHAYDDLLDEGPEASRA